MADLTKEELENKIQELELEIGTLKYEQAIVNEYVKAADTCIEKTELFIAELHKTLKAGKAQAALAGLDIYAEARARRIKQTDPSVQ